MEIIDIARKCHIKWRCILKTNMDLDFGVN